MKTWLNKNFGFNKAEFNGLLVLIFLIVILKSLPFLYDVFSKDAVDDVDVMSKIQKIEIADRQRYDYKKNGTKASFKERKESKLFYFDPNTIDVVGWQNLGLSQKQAQAIVNYTNKGGKFYKPEDLKKMYTISPEMYNRFFPFIKIEPRTAVSTHPTASVVTTSTFTKKSTIVVEINSADSSQLQQIRGIGPAFARRIVRYRTRLGGFIKKEQLLEVYGLDSAKFEEIKAQVSVDASTVKTININVADFEALKRFPYLSYKQINAIIQYRKQHGNFNMADDLKKVAILNQQVIDRMLPYISF
ncbi:competence protein ComEA [Pedobacter sp. UYP30]|uniref:ComEA family DNA-binding protein n=1 Tax=Pedobacter sp. UYP30 TaxID=1756400 RepID=UPI003393E794